MNPMNIAGMNPGNPAMGGMPMMNNGANGVQIRQPEEHEETNYESRLNTYIYSYFLKTKQYELARALKNSGQQFEPPIVHSEGNMNGANDQNDTKDGIDSKRPDDLPDVAGDDQSGSFLLNWFALFWDIYWAQRKSNRATPTARDFVAISQQQARQRDQQQQQIMRAMPGMMPDYQAQMMRQQQMMGGMANGDMRRGVLQNNTRPQNQQQMALFHNQLRQQQQQQQMMNAQMRRDPSDMNGQTPRTPSGADHAPSPSKRQRLDGVPFNGGQMMPNGRPMPPGMPGQQMMHNADPQAQHANQLLMNNGINPGNLSEAQFASFQQQNPQVQQKSIQVYAQNMSKHQRGGMEKAGGMSDAGSPMMPPGMDLNPDFFAGNPQAAQQMRGGMLPNGAPNGNQGNHALQDYQMQLMLLEQQNKKRLLMARQEQDTITRPEGQPGMPGPAGFTPGMSPQGSRGGPSPQPGDPARRGTPKMGQQGMPGSPMPNGPMTGSPAAINFSNMDPQLYNQMNGAARMQPPPSSNPGFPGGQITPQQMEAMQRTSAARMANGNGSWPGGPQGQAPMMQPGQPQPPPPMGTPQQRNNEMPPPQGVPAAAAANGRPGSPPAAPTPQQTNKANPKGKKDTKKKPTKKNSTASVAATPAADGDNPPATSTPSTPITPQHQNSFAAGKTEGQGQGQANVIQNATAAGQPQLAAPQPDPNVAAQFGNMDATNVGEDYNMTFNNDLSDPNLLENFDFEQFLQGDAFTFDAGAFEDGGIEAGGIGDA